MSEAKVPKLRATKSKAAKAKAVPNGAGRQNRMAKVKKAAEPKGPSRTETLIGLMRVEGGATAQALGEAVSWQVHSVRGFISGTLKKRADLIVTTERIDGATRYHVTDVEVAAQ